MTEFINNLITGIAMLSPIMKALIIGILLILDVEIIILIVKTHVNPKKPILKIGQFILAALFIFITVFVCIHV
ncbi:MAG: hypothetical protein E7378_01060 [Clostridiales bacterium]|nr:hypothetical protein [Clostridiales bacterium]